MGNVNCEVSAWNTGDQHRPLRSFGLSVYLYLITLAASSGKRNVTVWRPSVCLSRRYTHCDSPGGSMLRDDKEDRHTSMFHRQNAVI